MGRLFGTDGIRGIYGEELNSALARNVGRALVSVLPKGDDGVSRVLIGMDTRLSSDLLADSVMLGISDVGGHTDIMGVCSTPAVAYLVKKHCYDAGVMISASHNPCEYNGIKIFGSDGFKLSDELEERIEELILDSDTEALVVNKKGTLKYLFDEVDEYADYIVDCCDASLEGLRVGIDCANGSASATAERIFTRLGAECHMLADSPDGININKDCGSTHMENLRRLVKENGLDVGIAFDGDADRCLAIDENGNDVDGDFIIAILAEKLKSEGRLNDNCVVGTVMSNLGLVKFCERNGITFESTKVGDRYVLERLNEKGLSLGGEQSGHIILRQLATTGDGQLTAVALLSHIKKSGKSLSALASVMKKYPQYMINVRADSDDKAAFKTDAVIKELIAESEREMGDGGRILIRPSGTEHLIRVMTEGEDPEMAERVCTRLAQALSERLKELKKAVEK